MDSFLSPFEVFSDLFDAFYPDATLVSVYDNEKTGFFLVINEKKWHFSYSQWKKLRDEDKLLIKLGIIHKFLDKLP